MTPTQTPPPVATPRVAAGALFFDDEGRVLLVKPYYKDHWDIPGGYVEPGESPRAACIREVREELGLTIDLGPMLVVDWAPAPNEGDKILFVFDARQLGNNDQRRITFPDGELIEWRFIALENVNEYAPARLARRIRSAVVAKQAAHAGYAEYGDLA
ncbi:NUDIX hydrolase [Micromonospora sp. WMMD1102]|uniref:NUDIX domain-containing protein n=1 Tax=Micromonospora sp. WMMD1102 TaxID=3016105 RepID=UPI00241517CF|nr:NUDIX hydrolase [Micromonospora sp. WMMD1102]MDG4789308.1 NUDIX hydrolase [Micromonospora sp. WMMD1102]